MSLGFAACTGDDGSLEERCTEARGRLAQARVDMMGPPPTEALAKDYAQHRKNYEGALGATFVETCTKRGDSFASCILDADTPHATLDCTRGEKAKQALRKSARRTQ